MQILDVLSREHRWIRRLLRCLEQLVANTEAAGSLDPERAVALIGLFETFADGSHQEKEEARLFPLLLARATPREARYIAKLEHDHQEERRRMAAMRSNLSGAIFGEPLCLREFLHQARAYLEVHRKHLAHEDVVLFPFARRLFAAEDEAESLDGFGDGAPIAVERIRALCDVFGVSTHDDDVFEPSV